MAEAFVYDHIRTPRGKGKKDGALHEVKPVDLVVGLLDEVQDAQPVASTRTASTTSCSASSRRSATRAATSPRPPRSRPATPRPSPASSSTASAPPASRPSTRPPSRVRGGFEDLILAGGVESMSRVPMGSDGGAWATDPATALRDRLRARRASAPT